MYEGYSGPLFQDRPHAAELLAAKLDPYLGLRPLVLGIPRGGVVLARLIADRLRGDLDVILVRKIGAPGQPELAIGAVTESGYVRVSDRPYVQGIPRDYILEEARQAVELLRRRRALYTPHRAPLDPSGRIAIIVDDGIATGATVEAALEALREAKAAKRVVAAAVAPAATLQALREKADEVVCLAVPEDFFSVSQFFEDFSEVTDLEVLAALRGAEARRAG